MVIEIRDSVVLLSGMLRSNHWPAIMAAVHLALQAHPHGIVIDCAELDYVTANGAQTFAAALQHIETTNLPIMIARLPASIASELGSITDGRSHHYTSEPADTVRIAQAIYSDLWWERLWG